MDTIVEEFKPDWGMAMTPKFTEFPSISRLSRECVVTEKLDGTNAQIHITDNGRMYAGSRSRWIVPEDDNYGFAKWAYAHQEELMLLGPGSHFGEWWGQGIQRKYGLTEKRFSLFNTHRWSDIAAEKRPDCCHVVPVIYTGLFDTAMIDAVLALLATNGSYAAPGFMQPEGIVIWHEKARVLFKKTIGDDGHKSMKNTPLTKTE